MDSDFEKPANTIARKLGPFPHEVSFPLGDFVAQRNCRDTVEEPARSVPVLTECDVAVLGGGPAGVCAAAAAARAGKRVVLIERYGSLGGMATAANVNIWHSLYGSDRETKVIGGLAEEIIRRLLRLDAAYNKAKDGETEAWIICTETAKLVFDDMVVGSGVRLLLHSFLVSAIVDQSRITEVIIENKSGRSAVRADVFIDCTGDADLVRRSGLQTQLGNLSGRCQPPTLCFRTGGRADGARSLTELQPELYKNPMDYNGQHYPCFLWGTHGTHSAAEQMFAGTRVLDVNGADAIDLTRAEVEARYQMRWVLDRLREQPGWEHIYLTDIAAQIGVRESHRVLADYQLTRDDVLTGKRFDDTIAQGTYPIDIHNPDGPGITFEFLDGRTMNLAGDRTETVTRWDGAAVDAPLRDTLCWSVPYRSLIPRGLDNVLVAGRCIGAEHDAAGAIRVMINAMQFGDAAGVAAALTPEGGNVRDVDAAQLRRQLIRDGSPLL